MLLVVGATGELGGRVVRMLRARGVDVRCLLRPGTDDSALVRLGASVARSDLLDPAGVEAACRGVDTVVATATAMARRLTGDRRTSIREVDERGMAGLVAAAERAGVERFVFVSYAGIDTRLGFPLEHAKLATEALLAASPMRAVIVRPDAFQDIHLAPLGRFDMAAGKVAVFGRGDTPRRWVSTDDVAALLAAVALEPDPPRMVEFGGSEALSRNEAIAAAERCLGRPLRRQRMPRFALGLGMRLLRRPNDALASVFGTALHQELVPPRWDDSALLQRGITPRSASEFLRDQAHRLPQAPGGAPAQ